MSDVENLLSLIGIGGSRCVFETLMSKSTNEVATSSEVNPENIKFPAPEPIADGRPGSKIDFKPELLL